MHDNRCVSLLLVMITICGNSSLLAQSRQAPPGMYKELDDLNLGQAVILHGKQLFIDK